MKNKTVLITRFKADKEQLPMFKDWLLNFIHCNVITKIYILCSTDDKIILNSISNKIVAIPHKNPSSPTAMNTTIKKMPTDTKFFIVASKEIIGLKEKTIIDLINEISKFNINKKLVVGYKFNITDKKLNQELQEYYKKESLIAYKVPWNTCAIWDYNLFMNYVNEFDVITNLKCFAKLTFNIDGIDIQTDQQGMEDGLAIAKASSNKNNDKVYFKLLNKKLDWNIPEYDILRNTLKFKRKDIVLRNFMAIREYSIKDLITAKI